MRILENYLLAITMKKVSTWKYLGYIKSAVTMTLTMLFMQGLGSSLDAHVQERLIPEECVSKVPLTDLKNCQYQGHDGGLYGNGLNMPPAEHEAAARQEIMKIVTRDPQGNPTEDGQIGVISIGMSNTRMEFATFMELVEKDRDVNHQVVLVNGAQGSMGAPAWLNPDRRRDDTGLNTWEYLAKAVNDAGLTPEQVQVAWMKQVRANPSRVGGFPEHANELADQLAQIAELARQTYPNLRVMYLSSRIYAGYATRDLHPEPYAYETAFSVRRLIQEQINGSERLNYDPGRGEVKVPLLLWGPYIWTDGRNGRQIDDLIFTEDDLAADGTHPSDAGRQKVANVMLKFFKNHPLTRNWFRNPPHPQLNRGAVTPFRMIGDVYYVGNGNVSSHLITSSEGHILIDAGWPGDGPAILESVIKLGFDPEDIQYVLVTHGHLDHIGDSRWIAWRTGAKIAIHSDDVPTAENPDRSMYGLEFFEPVKVALQLNDGDIISVGDKQVHVHHTPGHTPGTVSFSFKIHEDGKSYRAVMFGGPGVNVFTPRAVERNVYGGSMDDFFKSLNYLEDMNVDVWLTPHPNLNETLEKRDQLLRDDDETPNPFIDPQGWKIHITERRRMAEQLRN